MDDDNDNVVPVGESSISWADCSTARNAGGGGTSTSAISRLRSPDDIAVGQSSNAGGGGTSPTSGILSNVEMEESF